MAIKIRDRKEIFFSFIIPINQLMLVVILLAFGHQELYLKIVGQDKNTIHLKTIS
jgi:hypothetical protein